MSRLSFFCLMLLLSGLPPARAEACSRPIVMPVAQAVLGPGQQQPANAVQQRLRELGQGLGCSFSFPLVPRPRLQYMLLEGQADVMLPAAREPERDAVAHFVLLWHVQPALLMRSKDARRPPSLQALVADVRLRGLMVRGQSWGGALEQALDAQAASRLQRVGDLATILRMLVAGRADFSLITPELLAGLSRNEELAELVGQLELRPLAGLPGVEAGAYLSRRLSETDRTLLSRLLANASLRQLLHAEPAASAAR